MKNTVSIYVRERGSRKFDLAKPKFGVPGGFPNGTIFALRYKRPDGKRTFETLGDSITFTEAKGAALRREADLLLGKAPAPKPKPVSAPKPEAKPAVLMLDAAIDKFLHEKRHTKTSTVVGYKWTLMQFYRAVGNRPLAEISKEHFNLFIDAMKAEGLSNRTQANRVTEVGSMIRHFGLTPKLPKVKYVEHEAVAYRPDELHALFAIGNSDDHLLWQFLLGTGMREMEAAHASFDDIDWVDKIIVIGDKPDFGWEPKDYERREIPLNDQLLAALHQRFKERGHGLLFPRADGGVDYHMLRDHLRVPAFKAGLNCGRCTGRLDLAVVSCKEAAVCKKWGLHRFRKTYATLQSRDGVDPRTIQKRLGHSSLETTLRYLQGEDARSEKSREQVNSTFGNFWKEPDYLTQ